MIRGLFIGRFQPLHKGHVDAISQFDVDEVVIVVADKGFINSDNPFSVEDRVLMVRNAFPDLSVHVILDNPDDDTWYSNLCSIVGRFDIVMSGNDHVISIIENNRKEIVRPNVNISISGTKIREMLRSGDESWKSYVPPVNWQIVEESFKKQV